MTDEPGEQGCIDRDEPVADDTDARLLFESGDMGLRPGQRYPSCLGNGEHAQRWRAVMGSREEDHVRGLQEQAQGEHPDRYIRKLRRRPRTLAPCANERLIGADQFTEAYNAVAYANSCGAILNTHITLTWPLLGYEEDAQASAALQSEFIKHLREWYRHKEDPLGRPLAWLYVHERSAALGLHTHFLVSIPLEWHVEFKAWLNARIARLSRRRPRLKGAAHVSPVRADRVFLHQWRLFGYLMKSVDPRASVPVFPGSMATVPLTDLVEWAQEGPGEVRCKLRVGIAHEIRKSARTRAQYRSLLECGVTDVRLLFGDYDYKGWEWAQQEVLCASMTDRAEAELLALNVASVRERADEEFQQRYMAWLCSATAHDQWLREANEQRARQLAAVSRVLGSRSGAVGGEWQPPAW